MKNRLYSIKIILFRIIYYYIFRNAVLCAKKIGVTIGDGCKILDDPGKVFGSEPWLVAVGNNCEFTNGVRVITHEGGLWVLRNMKPSLKNCDLFRPVVVGNNVMIGNYSIIMPGVVIGDNVIIGAHSVVTSNLESGYIYAGVPAKRIRTIESFIAKIENSKYLYMTKNLTQVEKLKIVKMKKGQI